jgi:hypothetical protein
LVGVMVYMMELTSVVQSVAATVAQWVWSLADCASWELAKVVRSVVPTAEM